MVEYFDEGSIYIDSFEQRDMDPIDFYKDPKLRPKVIWYEISLFAYVNGIFLDKTGV